MKGGKLSSRRQTSCFRSFDSSRRYVCAFHTVIGEEVSCRSGRSPRTTLAGMASAWDVCGGADTGCLVLFAIQEAYLEICASFLITFIVSFWALHVAEPRTFTFSLSGLVGAISTWHPLARLAHALGDKEGGGARPRANSSATPSSPETRQGQARPRPTSSATQSSPATHQGQARPRPTSSANPSLPATREGQARFKPTFSATQSSQATREGQAHPKSRSGTTQLPLARHERVTRSANAPTTPVTQRNKRRHHRKASSPKNLPLWLRFAPSSKTQGRNKGKFSSGTLFYENVVEQQIARRLASTQAVSGKGISSHTS